MALIFLYLFNFAFAADECVVQVKPRFNLSCDKRVRCKQSQSKNKAIKLDLNKKIKDLGQIFELIALSPQGEQLVRKMLPSLLAGQYKIKQITMEEKVKSGMSVVPHALYDYRTKSMPIDFGINTGILAIDIFHGMFHSQDVDGNSCSAVVDSIVDELNQLEQSSIQLKDASLASLAQDLEEFSQKCYFKMERSAFDSEFKVMKELEKVIPCYRTYSLSNGDFQSVDKRLSDKEIIMMYGYKEEYFTPSPKGTPDSRAATDVVQ